MSKTHPISAVVITFNEIHNIERCIQSLKQVCDEIIIIDSHSDDGTADTARELGCEVHDTDWKGYSATKNFGNKVAANNWILSLDADECLSDELIESIRSLELQDTEVYLLQRLTNYCGKWIKHAGWYPDHKARLFHKKYAKWEGEHVHEILSYPSKHKEVVLEGHLLHYSFVSIQDHINREKKYSRLAARRDKDKPISLLGTILSMTFKFIRMYFFKGGFKDGSLGRHLCTISAKGKLWKYREIKKLRS